MQKSQFALSDVSLFSASHCARSLSLVGFHWFACSAIANVECACTVRYITIQRSSLVGYFEKCPEMPALDMNYYMTSRQNYRCARINPHQVYKYPSDRPIHVAYINSPLLAEKKNICFPSNIAISCIYFRRLLGIELMRNVRIQQKLLMDRFDGWSMDR